MIHVPSTGDASAFWIAIVDNTTVANREVAIRRLDFPAFIDDYPIRFLKNHSSAGNRGEEADSGYFPDSV
jgi:hypothetical protein